MSYNIPPIALSARHYVLAKYSDYLLPPLKLAGLYADVRCGYAIHTPVHVDVAAVHGADTRSDAAGRYDLTVAASADVAAQWQAVTTCAVDVSAPWVLRGPVAADVAAPWALTGDAVADVAAAWGLGVAVDVAARHGADCRADVAAPWALTVDAVADVVAVWDGDDTARLVRDWSSPWTLLADALAVDVPVATVVAGGVEFEPVSLALRADDAAYCVSLDMALPDVAAYLACGPGAEVVVTLGGQEWRFVVDTRLRSQKHGQAEWTVQGRSVSARMGEGFARGMRKTWGRITARGAAEEIAAVYGLAVDWRCVGWVIPAGVLTADGETPIEVVRKLAVACGGIVLTRADGTLEVRPGYAWGAEPGALYGVDDDIFEMDESLRVLPGYNLVRVSDRQYETEGAVTLEEAEYDHLTRTATVRVWVQPWDAGLRLEATAGGVTVLPGGVVTEQAQEWVEFKAGVGSLERPARRVVAVDWRDHPDLGPVTADGTELRARDALWSLALVTYERSFHVVRVTRANGEPGQVVAWG